MSGAEFAPRALWGVQFARLNKQGSLFVLERLRPHGLGTGLHPYLLALEAGPVHQESLSEALSVDKANTARAVAKLESLGLLVRNGEASDKRRKVVQLTEKGRALLGPIKDALWAWEARLREGMEESEVKELGRLLCRVLR